MSQGLLLEAYLSGAFGGVLLGVFLTIGVIAFHRYWSVARLARKFKRRSKAFAARTFAGPTPPARSPGNVINGRFGGGSI